MEKLLAMSILSSGPDVPGINVGNWLRSQRGRDGQQEVKAGGDESSPVVLKETIQKLKPKQPRFAVELDGLCCFETIVSS